MAKSRAAKQPLESRFVLHRFNGDEVYRFKSSEIMVLPGDEGVDLHLEVRADEDALQRCDDTAEFPRAPKAEAVIHVLDLDYEEFDFDELIGRKFSIRGTASDDEDEDEEEDPPLLSYYEHEALLKNKITIVSRTEDRIWIKWTGVSEDVNFYDGSKPQMKVEIEGEFVVDEFRTRSNEESVDEDEGDSIPSESESDLDESLVDSQFPLSIKWLTHLTDRFNPEVGKLRFLQAMNAPQNHPMFGAQGRWSFGEIDGDLQLVCDDESQEFGNLVLDSAAISMAMLAYGLPVGDPARLKMVDLYLATMKALNNPDLLLPAARRFEYFPGQEEILFNLAQAAVGRLQPLDSLHYGDNGLVAAAVNSSELLLAFRPSILTTDKREERLNDLVEAVVDGEEVMIDFEVTTAVRHCRCLHWSGFRRLIERIEDTPVPTGDYETNPLLSAPATVKKVVAKLGLSREAAAYYLQLLTLPDPTDKNIILWNGWQAKTLQLLGQELLAQDLVVQDSRRRAGRKLFLPGGWENALAPDLPLETWKVPFYDVFADEKNRLYSIWGRIVPIVPTHELFKDAWARTLNGDLPENPEAGCD